MALINNKKVRFNLEILEEFEAGLELFGFEVKSLRAGRGSLPGSRVIVRGGEAYLVGANIPPWQEKNAPKDYDSERPRRLLLSKKEIAEIANAEEKRGLTTVPLSVYNAGRKLKLKIGVARGKKKHDKRQTIKARDEKRSIDRTLKNQY
jgi:SsrA-binding protein